MSVKSSVVPPLFRKAKRPVENQRSALADTLPTIAARRLGTVVGPIDNTPRGFRWPRRDDESAVVRTRLALEAEVVDLGFLLDGGVDLDAVLRQVQEQAGRGDLVDPEVGHHDPLNDGSATAASPRLEPLSRADACTVSTDILPPSLIRSRKDAAQWQ